MKTLRAFFRYLKNPNRFVSTTALLCSEATFWHAEAVRWHALYRIRLCCGDAEGAQAATAQFQFCVRRHTRVTDEHKEMVGY